MGRTLLTGWFSFPDGEATAGDVLALARVQGVLERAGYPCDTAWSPAFKPDALHLDAVHPRAYSRLVFVCGPLHGPQVADLHRRFPHCLRIAVGTSVIDAGSPAVTGFHRILARDGPAVDPVPDLSARAPAAPAVPVVGVILTRGQREYGARRRHEQAADRITRWLLAKDCARVELETRLDTRDWRLCATPAQLDSLLGRLDLVVTDRLHGLVLSLRAGVPALAVDPVESGAKVTAQARSCDWPALVPAEHLDAARLAHWWDWCLTEGRDTARRIAAAFRSGRAPDSADALLEALTHQPPVDGHPTAVRASDATLGAPGAHERPESLG
ncbi:polysaccharide pyruvyl transferase family protein [Streptomyces sp. NPDC051636]|uniref:polysaccharide pyruvyl transferase family protein n=1 Tax=Streptomyces sp. NPDC051636 TaxID=3365663 RepID=UPI0037AC9774